MTDYPKADLAQMLDEAANFVKSKFSPEFKAETAIILGSGLSDLAQRVKAFAILPYKEIPGFVLPTTAGHNGELIFGELNGKKVILLSGRIHFYEGYSLSQTTFPVRLMARCNIKNLILTSAVGAINKKYRPGDLVALKDHINLMGTNPLRGAHDSSFGERFPDMSSCYSLPLQKMALEIAKKMKIKVHSGIYIAVSGPSYETPAEIRAFRKLGGDVVGMSTAPEAITANQMKLNVLAFSYISNMAAGILKQPLSHHEVLQAGKIAGQKLSRLISEALKKI